jgi:fluoroacetyl-CoA thioesterase
MGGGGRGRPEGRARPEPPAEPWMEQLAGAAGTSESTVTEDMTAAHLGSGDVPALATPMVLLLVERAAVAALQGKVPDGRTTVGSAARLQHLAPTPVGGTARATARVEDVSGRKIRFSFSVADGAGEVARGFHVRSVVDRQRFQSGAAARAR